MKTIPRRKGGWNPGMLTRLAPGLAREGDNHVSERHRTSIFWAAQRLSSSIRRDSARRLRIFTWQIFREHSLWGGVLCLTELCFSSEVGIKEGAEGFRIWLGLISDDVLVKFLGGCEGWLGLLLLPDIIVRDAIYFSFEEDQVSRFLLRQNSRVGCKCGPAKSFFQGCRPSLRLPLIRRVGLHVFRIGSTSRSDRKYKNNTQNTYGLAKKRHTSAIIPPLPRLVNMVHYPYNVWFFWVGRNRSIILAKKTETFSGRFWEIPGNVRKLETSKTLVDHKNVLVFYQAVSGKSSWSFSYRWTQYQ